jgi:hypothetical protein
MEVCKYTKKIYVHPEAIMWILKKISRVTPYDFSKKFSLKYNRGMGGSHKIPASNNINTNKFRVVSG